MKGMKTMAAGLAVVAAVGFSGMFSTLSAKSIQKIDIKTVKVEKDDILNTNMPAIKKQTNLKEAKLKLHQKKKRIVKKKKHTQSKKKKMMVAKAQPAVKIKAQKLKVAKIAKALPIPVSKLASKRIKPGIKIQHSTLNLFSKQQMGKTPVKPSAEDAGLSGEVRFRPTKRVEGKLPSGPVDTDIVRDVNSPLEDPHHMIDVMAGMPGGQEFGLDERVDTGRIPGYDGPDQSDRWWLDLDTSYGNEQEENNIAEVKASWRTGRDTTGHIPPDDMEPESTRLEDEDGNVCWIGPGYVVDPPEGSDQGGDDDCDDWCDGTDEDWDELARKAREHNEGLEAEEAENNPEPEGEGDPDELRSPALLQATEVLDAMQAAVAGGGGSGNNGRGHWMPSEENREYWLNYQKKRLTGPGAEVDPEGVRPDTVDTPAVDELIDSALVAGHEYQPPADDPDALIGPLGPVALVNQNLVKLDSDNATPAVGPDGNPDPDGPSRPEF